MRGIGRSWRHIGSIQLIAGPDLALANLEPHEFIDFVSGRLSREFISNATDLRERMDQAQGRPDPDGRFRVNEFFCHDDTWRATLQALARSSDAVLMDLRGFSRDRSGCIYELGQLLELVPLRHITLLVDRTTDHALLASTLHSSWLTIDATSPNLSDQSPSSADPQHLGSGAQVHQRRPGGHVRRDRAEPAGHDAARVRARTRLRSRRPVRSQPRTRRAGRARNGPQCQSRPMSRAPRRPGPPGCAPRRESWCTALTRSPLAGSGLHPEVDRTRGRPRRRLPWLTPASSVTHQSPASTRSRSPASVVHSRGPVSRSAVTVPRRRNWEVPEASNRSAVPSSWRMLTPST